MFFFHLRDVLTFIAIFSLPALLLELQLLFIGLNGMTGNVMIATALIGALSALGAVIIEEFDL
jgi:energy-converting hydrogenase Eha subunit A